MLDDAALSQDSTVERREATAIFSKEIRPSSDNVRDLPRVLGTLYDHVASVADSPRVS